MASYSEVFERKEKKYRLDAAQHRAVLYALEGRMRLDAFGATKVTSLYFDTPDRHLIERSLDKPLYKEKLRLRRYGDNLDEGSCSFLEIKKKCRGVVYKRRVGLSLAAARAYLDGVPYEKACVEHPLNDLSLQAGSTSPRSLQIAREIDAFRVRYEALVPSMVISCERSAYAPVAPDGPAESGESAAVGSALRVTFDADISYGDCFAQRGFSQECLAHSLLGSGEVIMEVKNVGPLPLWLVRALSEAKAYPSSFSKYGEAYRRCMAGEG